MAVTLVRMVEAVRTEAKTAFSTTGTAYFMKYVSEDGAKTWWHIFGEGAPSTNYDDAPLDSLYTDTTNHKLYIHTATSTWTVVGAQS